VIGFFNTYRDGKRVTRNVLGEIAEQYKDAQRDNLKDAYFKQARADQIVVIVKAREPGRILIANGNRTDNGWHLPMSQRWIIQYNFYLNDARWGRMFVRPCPYFPFTARVCLNQHHWLIIRMREEKIDFQQRTKSFLRGCCTPRSCGNQSPCNRLAVRVF
jgi:hypothetical protein